MWYSVYSGTQYRKFRWKILLKAPFLEKRKMIFPWFPSTRLLIHLPGLNHHNFHFYARIPYKSAISRDKSPTGNNLSHLGASLRRAKNLQSKKTSERIRRSKRKNPAGNNEGRLSHLYKSPALFGHQGIRWTNLRQSLTGAKSSKRKLPGLKLSAPIFFSQSRAKRLDTMRERPCRTMRPRIISPIVHCSLSIHYL